MAELLQWTTSNDEKLNNVVEQINNNINAYMCRFHSEFVFFMEWEHFICFLNTLNYSIRSVSGFHCKG